MAQLQRMVVADATGAAFCLRGLGYGHPEQMPLADGFHMITSSDPNDMTRERVARHLPRFRSAPSPETDDYAAWRTLITDRSGAGDEQLHVVPRHGCCASASADSVLELARQRHPVWLFTKSSDAASFKRVDLSAS